MHVIILYCFPGNDKKSQAVYVVNTDMFFHKFSICNWSAHTWGTCGYGGMSVVYLFNVYHCLYVYDVCMRAHVWHSMHMEERGQLCGISTFLYLMEPWGLNSASQALVVGALAAESSCQPEATDAQKVYWGDGTGRRPRSCALGVTTPALRSLVSQCGA